MLERKERNIGLDLIRAAAISLVVLSHCSYLLGVNEGHPLTLMVRAMGALGVDLFFVLSGYLIGGLILHELEAGRNTWRDLFHFWKRRWLRTLPNYYLVLLLNIFLLFILGESLPSGIASFFVFLQNFISPHPDFFTEAWSLSVEEYAYLFLPFLLYTAIRMLPRLSAKRIFLYTVVLSISVLGILKFIYLFNTDFAGYFEWSAGFRKVVIYRLDSIYFGFLLIYLRRFYKDQLLKRKRDLFITGILILILVHVPLIADGLSPAWSNFFFSIIYLNAVIIGMGLTFPFLTSIVIRSNLKLLIYWVSTRSYAIYLVNYSIIQLTLLKGTSDWDLNSPNAILKLLIYLAFTIIISELLYRYFEYPILKWRNRNIPRLRN